MVDYTIKATPTDYAGVRFRSFLEARWAALFDLIDLRWEYEPCFLDGWLPDFRLDGRLYAEVKPFPPDGFGLVHHDYEATRKALREYETLLLGDGPGNNFGCLVSVNGDALGSRTVFYDEWYHGLLRPVGGDGADDPCRGNLRETWREAAEVISRSQRQEQTRRWEQGPTKRRALEPSAPRQLGPRKRRTFR